MSNSQDPNTETIAETENFMAWRANEPDGETTLLSSAGTRHGQLLYGRVG
jgi:hypothetical protein